MHAKDRLQQQVQNKEWQIPAGLASLEFRRVSELEARGVKVTSSSASTLSSLPSSLMNIRNGESETPHIIHQTWKTADIPAKLASYSQSVRDLHPEYEWRLHTDADIYKIVQRYTPQYYDWFCALHHHIERVDFVRYVLLYFVGGVYMDLDMQPLKSVHSLVQKNSLILAGEPDEHSKIYMRLVPVISNAMMISPPGQQFWLDFMAYIVAHYYERRWMVDLGSIYATGPMALTTFYEGQWDRDKYGVILLSSCSFFPQTDGWTNIVVGEFESISSACHDLSQTYAIQRWGHSWMRDEARWILDHKALCGRIPCGHVAVDFALCSVGNAQVWQPLLACGERVQCAAVIV